MLTIGIHEHQHISSGTPSSRLYGSTVAHPVRVAMHLNIMFPADSGRIITRSIINHDDLSIRISVTQIRQQPRETRRFVAGWEYDTQFSNH